MLTMNSNTLIENIKFGGNSTLAISEADHKFLESVWRGDVKKVIDLHQNHHANIHVRFYNEHMNGVTALMATCRLGVFEDRAEYLIKKGDEVLGRFEEIASYLIKNGAEVDVRDSNNKNVALIEAVRFGNINIAKLLLDALAVKSEESPILSAESDMEQKTETQVEAIKNDEFSDSEELSDVEVLVNNEWVVVGAAEEFPIG